MNDNIEIRDAKLSETPAILELLPLLASFPIAADRNADDLWRHDAALLKRWENGNEPNALVHVAAARETGELAGFAITSLRAEILSGDSSAHLEALVVSPDFRRQNIAKRLIEFTEQAAKSKGAESITLHVFSSNEKARALYAHCDYQEELIRARKPLN